MRNIESNRTIKSILDLKTGNEILSTDFFIKSDDEIFKFRYELESDIREKRKRYVCYFCKQNIKLRGKKDSKKIFHFAHLKDSPYCILKTDNRYSKSEIERIKYNGAKESELHYTLKNKIASHLIQNQKYLGEIGNVMIEKVQKDKEIPRVWKKPDISADFKNLKVVFELQLSTTFLSVINSRQEFYIKNKTFIIWVFNHFEHNNDKRKFTLSDIYYNNNRNGFEFDENAQKLSNLENNLFLNCHFEIPRNDNGKLTYDWKNKYVNLSQLTFNKETNKVYYYDVEKEKQVIEKIITFENSRLYKIIKSGNLSDLFEWFKLQNLTDFEYNIIKNKYKTEIQNKEKIDKNSKELQIIWTLIAFKLKSKNLISNITNDFKLRKIIIDLLSLKTNIIIGYDYNRQIQIAHFVLDRFPEYLSYYEKGIDLWGNIGYDKENNIKRKILKIKQDNIKQEINIQEIEIIFPELAN